MSTKSERVVKYILERRKRDPEFKSRMNKAIAKSNKKRNLRYKLLLLKEMGGKCVCCDITEWWNLGIDHKIPLNSKKKSNNKELIRKLVKNKISRKNFQILCNGCNSSKHNKQQCTLDHSIT